MFALFCSFCCGLYYDYIIVFHIYHEKKDVNVVFQNYYSRSSFKGANFCRNTMQTDKKCGFVFTKFRITVNSHVDNYLISSILILFFY